MKIVFLTLTLAVGLSVPVTSLAQLSPPLPLNQIDRGTEVRVETLSGWREGSLARPLVLTPSDTVVVTGELGVVLRIPILSVRELQILQRSSRSSHLSSGALLGAALGAGVAFAVGQGIGLTPGGQKGKNAGGLAVVGGVIGGLLGGAIGASIGPREIWKEVQLPSR